MKVVIVGGVAGGASCAARLRRLDEKAEIVMVERGPYVSYANCGLPYHVSGVIAKESSLLVASAQMFREHFAIDARTNCEAVSVSPKQKTVDLRNVTTGKVTTESYDKLVLSPGAPSVRPPLPGIDLPGIFQVRTVPDVRTIREWIEHGTTFLAGMYNYSGIQFVKPTRRAVVIGGGFIGLEMAENLVHIGFEVTLVEMLDQVLAPLDREFAHLVEEHLEHHGVNLALGDGVAGFKQLESGAVDVGTKSGKAYPADIVILALGVRPDTTLAKTAGLEIGQRGGIRVDEHMRTSDPDIFAVGDAIEVKDFVTGQWSLVALAGPANRQGRIAASALAVAIQMGATIYDLEEAELCYAPQFGSAKDAVNFAGMVAADILHGDMPLAHWEDTKGAFLLDVREPVEMVVENVPGAVNIPLGQLRQRLGELPRDREILIICRSGQRAYAATRILLQRGFKARNISGGMLSHAMLSA